MVVTDAINGSATSNILGPITTSATLSAGTLSSGGVSSSSVALSFTGASGGSSPYSYGYKRGTDGVTFGTTLATHTGQTASDTLADNGVSPSTTYYYQVTVTDAVSGSARSNILGPVTTPAPTSVFTIAGPTTGAPGAGITYTFTPGASYSGTVTPTDGLTGGGGTWSPATLTFAGAAAQTSTYTGPGAGARSITATGTGASFNTIALTLAYTVAYSIVCKGDSLTYSQYASTGTGVVNVVYGSSTTTWPGVMVNSLGQKFQAVNRGVPGQQAFDVIGTVGAEAAGDFATGKANLAIVQYGTNDLRTGRTLSQLQSDIQSVCGAYRSLGYKVIIQTIEPAYLPSANITPTYDIALQQPYNAWLRANWKSFADAISDFSLDTRVGQAGAELNTTYFRSADNTHLTDAGYAVVAGYAAAAVSQIVNGGSATTTVSGFSFSRVFGGI